MKIQRLNADHRQPLYVWPEGVGPWKPEVAHAGPFETYTAALWWILGQAEEKLPLPRRKLWAYAVQRAEVYGPKVGWTQTGADPAHLLGLIGLIFTKASARHVLRCACTESAAIDAGLPRTSAIVGELEAKAA